MNKNIIFCGDTHGAIYPIIDYIERNKVKDQNFIHVGDFGIGFHDKDHEEEKLKKLNDFLKKDNNHLYVIRGNHDDPSYFYGHYILSNLSLLQDYTILQLEEHKVFLVGGAISIDRSNRAEGLSYWRNEKFVYNEEKIKEAVDCDIVVTHNCPSEFFPIGCDAPIVNGWHNHEMNMLKRDLKKELIEERALHSKMWNELIKKNKIKLWIYGHFHNSNNVLVDEMRIVLMNISDFWKY